MLRKIKSRNNITAGPNYSWRNLFWESHHQSWFSVSFQIGVANFNFNFLSHFCINFQNLCAHHQEEILRFPKHPQKSSFWWVLAEKTAKNKVATKIEYQKYFRKNLSSLEHHNLASDSSNWASRGCFGNLRTSSWWWVQSNTGRRGRDGGFTAKLFISQLARDLKSSREILLD